MKAPVTRAKAYLKVRHKNVREAMKQLKIDGLLLTHPPDLAYLTNFTGHDSVGLITAKDLYLVTDFRYAEQAAFEAAWVKTFVRDGKMAHEVAKALLESGVRRVGFEANFTTFGQVKALDDAVREALAAGEPQADAPAKKPAAKSLTPTASGRPAVVTAKAEAKSDGAAKKSLPPVGLAAGIELLPLEEVMYNQRKVKDDHEVDLIRKSIAVAEEAFNAVREEIEVGQSEAYLAGLMHLELRSRGADGVSFNPIIAAGANSSLPHYSPGETLVQQDQPLLMDWGATYGGYCSDMTRTFMIGQVSERMKKIYRTVLKAQEEAIRFIRPGVTTRQVDQVARDVIDRAGFAKQFGHGLGHGIGRDIHELPSMRKDGEGEELRPGMVITVEPGIYLPGEGGVRIEDDVLVTHSGCEVLTTLDKSLEACHIG